MKKIGLIGGTGPESTVIYYKELCKRIHDISGESEFPEIVIESVNLHKAVSFMENEDYDGLVEYLGEALERLVQSGAEVVALTAVTMHAIYDRLSERVDIPFISIPECVRDRALELGYHNVGLLGTKFTMLNEYMKNPLLNSGIEVAVPEDEDLALVHERIFTELEAGIVKTKTVNELVTIVDKMRSSEGIDAIILGCTELPLALNDANCSVPVLDAMRIHIEELVKQIYE